MALQGLLIALIVILAAGNAFQYASRRKLGRDLRYAARKLDSIIEYSTREQVLLTTDNRGLQEMLSAVHRLVELKRQFEVNFTQAELAMRKMLANISHDLKTPLTVVLGYMEIMVSRPDMEAAERDRLLAKVHAKVEEIVELINRFFDLAKLESGDTEIPMTRIHMNELCREAALAYYDLLESRAIEARIEIPESPIYAKGSAEALNRVLDNLLMNAVRYGADGGVVGLRLYSTEHEVTVEVWDQGKGIPVQDQRLIFERMYTLEDSRNPDFQGSGLGLTICKRLVERMDGEIAVRSRPGEGTAFTVSLRRLF